MKKVVILVLSAVMIAISPLMAQKKKGKAEEVATPVAKSPDLDSLAYFMAVANDDMQSATNSLYRLMAKNPNNRAYSEALVRTYYSVGLNLQCAKAAQNHLVKFPGELAIMELQAYALKNLGDIKSSLSIFESIQQAAPNAGITYRIAESQYLLKRMAECTQSIQSLMNNPNSDSLAVSIVHNNQNQNVPLKAAALNIYGMVLLEKNNVDDATKSFQAAIKEFPEFALAKANLELLKKAIEKQSTESK